MRKTIAAALTTAALLSFGAVAANASVPLGKGPVATRPSAVNTAHPEFCGKASAAC